MGKVIPVEARSRYMTALENTSVDRNIVPFAKFPGALITNPMAAKSAGTRK